MYCLFPLSPAFSSLGIFCDENDNDIRAKAIRCKWKFMFTIMQSTDILWNHLKIYEELIESDFLTTLTRGWVHYC